MARVHLWGELRDLAGGRQVLDVEARTVTHLLDRLDDLHPGLGSVVRADLAVAIDGEVMPNAEFAPLTAASEIHFLPPIAGG